MKTVLIAMLLATAIASPSNADPADFYASCCAVGSVRFRDLSKTQGGGTIMVGASNPTVYETRSQTIVRSNYGTTVINGVHRSSWR